jgi:hypothetical protein
MEGLWMGALLIGCFMDGGFMDWGLCFCFQKFFPEAVTPRFLRTSLHGLCQGFMGLKTKS